MCKIWLHTLPGKQSRLPLGQKQFSGVFSAVVQLSLKSVHDPLT